MEEHLLIEIPGSAVFSPSETQRELAWRNTHPEARQKLGICDQICMLYKRTTTIFVALHPLCTPLNEGFRTGEEGVHSSCVLPSPNVSHTCSLLSYVPLQTCLPSLSQLHSNLSKMQSLSYSSESLERRCS